MVEALDISLRCPEALLSIAPERLIGLRQRFLQRLRGSDGRLADCGDSADGDRSWPFIEAVLPIYRLYGGTARIGLFNHRKGHRVPREAVERIDKWFDVYL